MIHLHPIQKKVYCVFLFVLISLLGIQGYAETKVLVPVGQTVGVTLDMEGVTIMDTTDVEDYDGNRYTPAKDSGLRAGDVILTVNGVSITSAKQMEEIVNTQGEDVLEIVAKRHDERQICKVKAKLSKADGHYRLGVWLKDAASGIGTITYFDPETGEIGALGHGISDTMREDVLPIQGGEFWKATVVSIQKGDKGHPGELMGVFSEGKEKLGEIQTNTHVGLKGTISNAASLNTIMDAVAIANREEVQEGSAKILSNIEENKIEEYEVEIQKINTDIQNTKGMVIKVTDEKLLEKTGGIVQGMSGSPVIQNGKLVGAVTHVFVNDPTRGYGIFIENMLQD